MSTTSTLVTAIATVLRAAGLKVGDVPVVSIFEHRELYSIAPAQCPCITIEAEPAGGASRETQEDWREDVSARVIAVVATAQADAKAIARAQQLLASARNALRASATFGASVGSMDGGSWSGEESPLEGDSMVAVADSLNMTCYVGASGA